MISILRPLNSPTSYKQILCFSGSWANVNKINSNLYKITVKQRGNLKEWVQVLPFWQAWRTGGSRSSGSCSRSPSGGTLPSPGCTSHHRSSSARIPRSWRRDGVTRIQTEMQRKCVETYGPHSIRRERTRSMPISHTFMHSLLISIMRPWKFSWSNTYI